MSGQTRQGLNYTDAVLRTAAVRDPPSTRHNTASLCTNHGAAYQGISSVSTVSNAVLFVVPSSRIYENTRTCTDASGPDETEVDLEQHSPAEKEQESLERWAAITGTELHRAQASADGQADGLKEAQVYPPLKMTASAYTLRHPTHGWLAPSLPRRDRIAPQYVNNVQNSQRSIKPGEALLPV